MAKRNAPAWIMATANPKKGKKKGKKGSKKRGKTRRHSKARRRTRAHKVSRRKARRFTVSINPKGRRKKGRRSNPKRHARRRKNHAMMLYPNRRHRRKSNPHRRRNASHRRRRRNPGLFSGLFAPVKQHGLGFALGAAADSFAVSPLLANFLGGQPLVQSAAKIVVGPLLAGLAGKIPGVSKLGRHLESMGLYFVAVGIQGVVSQLLGGTSAAHGFGYINPFHRRRVASIGPTHMASIGPTHVASIGPTMHGVGAAPSFHQSNFPMEHSDYHQEYTG
jgi:hypothetical protein